MRPAAAIVNVSDEDDHDGGCECHGQLLLQMLRCGC